MQKREDVNDVTEESERFSALEYRRKAVTEDLDLWPSIQDCQNGRSVCPRPATMGVLFWVGTRLRNDYAAAQSRRTWS